MNHIYRNVWNEVTRTYVAAAEIVRGRGKRSKSSAGAEGTEAALAASSLLAEGALQAQAPPTITLTPKAAPQAERPAAPKRRKLTMSLPRPMALEQRFMFDGAAFGDAVNVVDRTAGDMTVRHGGADRFASRMDTVAAQVPQGIATPGAAGAAVTATAPGASLARPAGEQLGMQSGVQLDLQLSADQAPANVLTAQAEAQRLVNEFLTQPDVRERLFALFNGGDTSAQPSDAWNDAAQALLQSLAAQGETVRLELRSAAEMPNARGAFAALGSQGTPVIYLNADWAATQASPQAIADVMMEEIGHYLDSRINGSADTAGDEGERFAYALTHGGSVAYGVGTDDDHGVLSLDGVAVETEMASLTFPQGSLGSSGSWGAYRVNDNGGEGKESNQHTYDPNPASTANQITKVVITDALSAREFSGNDVSVLATFTFADNHTETYAGWISRPVKSGGQVQGFYFWTDTHFAAGADDAAKLALARADGNNDADGEGDNSAFLIVWNKSYFAGTGNSKTVGSSSDRVDASLNSLLPSNNAPTSVADTATVTEAGGVRTNQTASTTATGNVLDNDQDDAGDTKQVTKVGTNTASATVGSGSTRTSGATTVTGTYGDLTIGADGSYSYSIRAASNTLTAMEALRTSSNTLTDTFTYTMADGSGVTSTTTLTVTIQGNNDNPTANPDVNTAKESLLANGNAAQYTATDPLGVKATGNVLSNDADVDLNGEGATVTGIGATTNGTTPQTVTVSTIPLNSVTGIVPRADSNDRGDRVYRLVGGVWTDTGFGVLAVDPGAKTVQIYDITKPNPNNTTDLRTLTVSSGQELRFYATANNGAATSPLASEATAQVNLAAGTSASTSVLVDSIVGIGVGSTVTGTGVPANTTVTVIDASNRTVTLSQSVTLNNVALTFGATAGSTVSGRYGSLVLNTNGSYTYTPTAQNAELNEGQTVTEVFSYNMRDTAGAQSTSTLTITVRGSGTNDPDAKADTATAREAGGAGNGTAGINPTGNVLGGAGSGTGDVADSTPGGTTGPTVSAVTTAGGTTGTLDVALQGQFGTLTLSSTGAYTYTVTNANDAVQALRTSTETLTDTFVYTVTNSASRTDTATLTITIEGANDNPVASADAASLSEDNVVIASGNVLTNDSDVDSGDTKTVTKASTGTSPSTAVSASTTSATGLSITGTYGTVRIGSDGTYRYVLNNSAAVVQDLIKDQQVTDQFSYEVTDTAGATHTATLTFTITGANEPPVNQFNGSAFSSTSQTSVTGVANTVLAFTGTRLLSVAEPDNNLSSTVLTVENGSLSFSASTSGGLNPGNGSTVTITGTRDQVNEALARLQYTPTTNFTGAAFLTINSVDSEGARDIDGVAINIPTAFTGPTVNESDLGTGSTPTNTGEVASVTLSAPSGQTFGSSNQSGTDGSTGSWTLDASTGVFTYTLTNPVSVSGVSSTRDVNISTYDQYGNTVTNTVTVTIRNDSPIARADTDSVTEDTSTTATGNVITATDLSSGNDSNTTDGVADTKGADNASVTVVGVAAGTTNAALDSNTTVGAAVAGTYGSLNVAANGNYTYTLSNSSTAVQALNAGDSRTDIFTYTIKDADGSTSFTTLTITINGVNEGGPSIVINDNNGTSTGQETVAENAALSGKTFTLSTPDGLNKITVAGTDVTAAQLAAAGTTPVAINTPKGVLTITGFSSGTVTYSYDPTGTSQSHAAGEVSDAITIVVTDSLNATATGTLTVLISDTAPTAAADTDSVTEDSNTSATGNVITAVDLSTGADTNTTDGVADTQSADTTSITGVQAGSVATEITTGAGTPIAGTYGRLSLGANGDYTYTLYTATDTGAAATGYAALQAIAKGESRVDTFSYTLKDSDGNFSNATLAVTVSGANDSPVITVVDVTGAVTEDVSTVADNPNTSAVEAGSFVSDSGSLTFDDVDTSNTSTVTVALVGAHASSSNVSVSSALRYSALFDLTAIAGNSVNWPGTTSVQLAKTSYASLSNADFIALGYELMSQSSGTVVAFVVNYTDNTKSTISHLTAKGSLTGIYFNATDNANQQTYVRQVDVTRAEGILSRTASVSNPAGSLSDVGSTLKISGAGVSAAANDGSVNWAFALDNSKIQYLKAGETITATYQISVKDNSGVSTASGGDQVDTTSQLVTVTITGANDVPVAVDDSLTGTEDTSKTISSTDLFGADGTGNANDSDIDSASFSSITITELGTNGTLKLDGTAVTLNQVISAADINAGKLSFEPTANFNGNATFKYTVSDGTASSNVATVTIAVAVVNDAPVAADDSIAATQNTAKTISSTDLFDADGTGNNDDRDIDSSTFSSITITELGTNGTLKLDGVAVTLNQVITAADITANKLSFEPTNNFTGNATFKYTVSDGSASSNQATVTLNVQAAGAPVAVDDSLTGTEDTAKTISSTDLFGADGTGNSNDSDSDSPNFSSITITELGTNGTLKLNGVAVTLNQVITTADIAANKLTFEPTANFNGDATFKYTVSDGTTSSNVATVTIAVAAVNDAPLAVDDSLTGTEDTSKTISSNDLFGADGTGNINDSDIDSANFSSITITELGTNGTLKLNGVAVTLNQVITAADIAANKLSFEPTTDFNGNATFKYTVSDGSASSNVATVTIAVAAVNDAPVAADDSIAATQNTAKTISSTDLFDADGTGNNDDRDIDSPTFSSITITELATNGTLKLDGVAVTLNQVITAADIAANKLSFEPTNNFTGNATFKYTVSDGSASSNVATVTVAVAPAALPTVAISVNPSGISEGDASETTAMTYTVSLAGGTSATDTVVTLDLTGTATLTTDYAIAGLTATTTAGRYTITIPAGQTSATFTVDPVGDTVFEGAETVIATIASAKTNTTVDLTVTTAAATGTIYDDGSDPDGPNGPIPPYDDDRPTYSVGPTTIAEGGNLSFVVTRTSTSQAAQNVSFATSIAQGNTASANDFSATSGTLTFAPGETSKTFTVPTTPDSVQEGDETLTVTLSNVSAGGLLGTASATGTILDDDGAPVFTVANAAVAEGGALTFTVTRLGDAQAAQSVSYATSIGTGDTASANDFTAASGSLSFAQGETSKTFTVQTGLDTRIEADETLTVTLSNATGGASVSTTAGSAKGTITDDDRPDAVDDAFTLTTGGTVSAQIVERNDGPSPSTQLTITSISYTDAAGAVVQRAFGTLTDSSKPGFSKQVTLADGTLFINASGESLYEHAGRRFLVTATNPNGTLEYNATGSADGWRTVNTGTSVVVTLQDIQNGRLRFTPRAGGADVGATESSAASVVELDWRSDSFTYTVSDAGGVGTDTATVTYSLNDSSRDVFQNPISPASDADVDGIVTRVESVLANRARGLAAIRAETYVLDVENLISTGIQGQASARIGAAFDGDLNVDQPTGIGDGFQNAVTTFSWINNVYFDAANADPFTVDVKSAVTLVAEDTGTSRGVPDPNIQLRNVVVPALTSEQRDALQTFLRFTPGWTPLGFSAEIRAGAPADVTNIDQDPARAGFQWRFTVDISRTGETVNTFMGFIKWVDQATIDAYRAANLPLVDLTGDPITRPGWVDFTRIAPNGDGVSIGQSGSGNVLFLDYTVTDNAFGDMDLRPGYITDPGIPIFVVRTIDVTGRDTVNEGSNAEFTVKLNAPKSLPTEVALRLADLPSGTDSVNGQPLDYSPTFAVHYVDAQGARQPLTVTDGKITLPPKVTEFFVTVATLTDTEYEGSEAFSLTATLPEGTADTANTSIFDPSADLNIVKQANKINPEQGENVTFTLTVTNKGPGPANNVVVTDRLPPGLDFSSASGIGAYNPSTGTWTLGTLPSGASVTLTIVAKATSFTGVENSASVRSDQPDADPTDNSSSVIIDALGADLQLQKTVNNASPGLGENVVFTLSVKNAGPNDAEQVVVTDRLPAGLTFVSADSAYDAASGRWSLGTLENGATATLQITARVVSSEAVENIATVNSKTQDPRPGDRESRVTVDAKSADLGIAKTVSTASPNVGDVVEFKLTVVNRGPDAAPGVVVTDKLPDGLVFVSDNGAGTYDAASGRWSVGTLDNGASATLTIQARVSAAGGVTNTATVKSSLPDGDPANDSSSASTNGALPQISIDDVTVNEGAGTITFTVSRSGGLDVVSTVRYSTSDVTTTAGADYTADSGTLTLAKGQAAGTITLNIANDDLFELSESFNIRLSEPTNALVADGLGVGTIKDDGTGAGGKDDDRPLSVNSVTVNEGSPFAVFTVSGPAGQVATLALAGGTAGSADFGPGLEVWNGSAWVPYTGGPVTLPADGKLLVRTPILQDTIFEGAETFSLSATSASGRTATGTGTIVDDGTGDKFPDAPPGPDGTPPKGPGPFDDDRALSVNSVTVNEGSAFAVFTVSGAPGQVATLALAGGTAGSADFGPGLEVWNGSAWVPYTGGPVTLPADGKLLVRTPILQDTIFEGAETFSLSATSASGRTATGTGTIVDDGTGDKFPDAPPGPDGTPPKGPGPFDDDRALSVNSVTVNEGSAFAVFTVSGAPGQVATLALAGGTAGSADFGPGLEVWNGSAWVPYTGGPVTLPADGKLLVRTPILQDTIFEGAETFSLSATSASGRTATGTGTIVDDGTGDKFPDAPPGPDGTPPKGPGPFDDDRALSVNSVTVNEGSAFAVFTVSGAPGQVATLALAGGTAGSADFGPGLEVWNGSAWVPYTGGPVTLPADGKLLVRTPILQDTIFEGAETFSLSATSASGRTATGTGTIVDDGTGDKFPDAPPGPDGTPPKGPGPFDDDRALSVNSVTVNEGSAFAVFTVSGAPGQVATLALAGGTAGSADFGPGLEVWNGSAWVPYTGGPVTLPADGKLLVRTPILQDTIFEGAETFSLSATSASGRTATGTGTIVDDGTGDKFPDAPPGPDGTPPKDASPADDDRSLTVNDVSVSESSPFAVFTVTGQAEQRLSLALQPGSATLGTDTGNALQYFDGSGWRDYVAGSLIAIPPGGTTLLVRVAIVNDTALEGPETFRLVATTPTGRSAQGACIIFDDGTNGNVFDSNNTSGRPTQGVADDDTPPPPPPPPPPAPAPVTDASPPPPPVQAPAPAPAPSFDSAVAVTKPSSLPIPDRVAVGEIVTSSSGFPIRVIQSETPALMRDKGITDQFIEGNRVTTFNLPADAFAHTRSEAILTVIARQPNGQPLPSWVLFNPQSGTFTVTPPQGFTGELEIQVLARDNDGREAAATFKFNVGTGVQPDTRPGGDQPQGQQPAATPPRQGRLGVSDQIRLAGRDSNGLLQRVMSSRAVQERLAQSTREGSTAEPSGSGEKPARAAAERAERATIAHRVAAERVQPTQAPRPGA